MRRIALMALSLLSVAAASASAAVSAAAAEPVFERIVITPLKEGEKVPFTSKTGRTLLETPAKTKVACAGATDKGSIEGPTSLSLSVKFTGCESGAAKCTSAGAAEGEIVTNTFEGKLGNLKSGSTPGVALAQSKEHTNDAEFNCGATAVKLFGGVVGAVAPIGKTVSKLIVGFKESAGVQLFESLFGGPLEALSATFNGGTAESTGLEATDALTLAEPLQVS
jgi:hypothetical protein